MGVVNISTGYHQTYKPSIQFCLSKKILFCSCQLQTSVVLCCLQYQLLWIQEKKSYITCDWSIFKSHGDGKENVYPASDNDGVTKVDAELPVQNNRYRVRNDLRHDINIYYKKKYVKNCPSLIFLFTLYSTSYHKWSNQWPSKKGTMFILFALVLHHSQ